MQKSVPVRVKAEVVINVQEGRLDDFMSRKVELAVRSPDLGHSVSYGPVKSKMSLVEEPKERLNPKATKKAIAYFESAAQAVIEFTQTVQWDNFADGTDSRDVVSHITLMAIEFEKANEYTEWGVDKEFIDATDDYFIKNFNFGYYKRYCAEEGCKAELSNATDGEANICQECCDKLTEPDSSEVEWIYFFRKDQYGDFDDAFTGGGVRTLHYSGNSASVILDQLTSVMVTADCFCHNGQDDLGFRINDLERDYSFSEIWEVFNTQAGA